MLNERQGGRVEDDEVVLQPVQTDNIDPVVQIEPVHDNQGAIAPDLFYFQAGHLGHQGGIRDLAPDRHVHSGRTIDEHF